MKFDIEKAMPILERTPAIVSMLVKDLDHEWTHSNEGPDTWSAYDVVGHYIHGEKTDWIPRLNIILGEQNDKRFEPFDRFAQFRDSQGKSLDDLLEEFARLRRECLDKLRQVKLDEHTLAKTGIHPAFGEVTLANLLASWVVHDLGHISQITRVIAKQYKEAVGPWTAYMSILNR